MAVSTVIRRLIVLAVTVAVVACIVVWDPLRWIAAQSGLPWSVPWIDVPEIPRELWLFAKRAKVIIVGVVIALVVIDQVRRRGERRRV